MLRKAGTQPARVAGVQPTVVLLVNFTNATTEPVTVATIRSWFPATDAFFRENSYGTVSLPADVSGWYTLPMVNTGCAYWSIQAAADRAATAAGVNLAAYVRRVYLFPYTTQCQFGGMGTVGGNPSFIWINGDSQWATMNHEAGHTVGLYHSHSISCTGSVLTPPCTTQEYGDVSTTMGATAGHFAVFQKLQIGWLGTAGMPPITTVAQSGLYPIDFYDSPLTLGAPARANHRLPVFAAAALPKALKIPRGTTSQAFYVRLSRPGAFDKYAGVFVSLGTDGQPDSSFLLDMTPATKMNGDQFLAVGQTFTDPVSRVALTTISVGAAGAVIQVAMKGAEPPPPPPPPPPPGIAGENSITFTLVSLVAPQTLTVAVPPTPYECVRQTGGSSFLRIYSVNGSIRTLRKQVGVPNPTRGSAWTMRCVVGDAAVSLYLSGALKATVAR